jgi:opacity protein-like surface antigen
VKGKIFLSLFALLMPASLVAQVAQPAADIAPPLQRYEIFAGVDYTTANQVKSSSALIGGNVGGAIKLNKFFGGTVDFGDYGLAATNNGLVKPTVTTLLAGPEFYIPSDKITGFLHVLFGGEHTGATGAKPDVAFAYAVGGGVEYELTRHISARASGDGVWSSFVLDPNNTGASPHLRVNARASGGIAYRF